MRIFRIVGRWPGQPSVALVADGSASRWEDVKPASGTVVLKLQHIRASAKATRSVPCGAVLVELRIDRVLRLECFSAQDTTVEFAATMGKFER